MATVANAADAVSYEAAPAEEAAFNWSGAYIGLHVGYGSGHIDGTTTNDNGVVAVNAARESADQDVDGGFGGLQIGYNFQPSGIFVWGVEADVAYLGIDGTDTDEATAGAYLGETASVIEYEFDWMATIRGRAGVALDRFMLYGTAGVAFLGETESRTQYIGVAGETSPSFTEEDDATRVGWTVGAGGEFALNERWSIKGEYLFAKFSGENFEFSDARGGVGNNYANVTGRNATNEADIHTVKFGVNYRF
jgi:hemoglobin/transferrin/lactoferrin receptor protein